jgi:hypothetical protein
MSTPNAWKDLVKRYTQLPKPRYMASPNINPTMRMRDHKKLLLPTQRTRAPTVLPYIEPKVKHYRTEVQGHLRKRRLQPAMRDWRMPVTILSLNGRGQSGSNMPFVWQRLRNSDLKMVSRSPSAAWRMLTNADFDRVE